MLEWYLVHAQSDLNKRIVHMFEGTFSLDSAKNNTVVYDRFGKIDSYITRIALVYLRKT